MNVYRSPGNYLHAKWIMVIDQWHIIARIGRGCRDKNGKGGNEEVPFPESSSQWHCDRRLCELCEFLKQGFTWGFAHRTFLQSFSPHAYPASHLIDEDGFNGYCWFIQELAHCDLCEIFCRIVSWSFFEWEKENIYLLVRRAADKTSLRAYSQPVRYIVCGNMEWFMKRDYSIR